ncbi:MAG: prepilin-type N-terminal cleavage/methylation domain-containing protein [Gammaproteobacteria bacterium]|nr:prepilin-type N-terminal cleavage/methylation domain-containing protein [Gammaproteobacteria bacterium]
MKRSPTCRRAFSILELMLVLAVSSILATIAVVLYQDYVETARLGVLDAAIASIEPFQEAHTLENGSYAEGSWRFDGPDDESLFDAIGWRPTDEQADLVVKVTVTETGFQVRASNSFDDAACREFPSRRACSTTP